MPTSLLFADRPDDISRVRQALAEAGFTAAKVLEVIGPHGFTFLSRHELVAGPRPQHPGHPPPG